jgi:hypothetical protein
VVDLAGAFRGRLIGFIVADERGRSGREDV